MTGPSDERPEQSRDDADEAGREPLDFDPYRFGRPDHPIPPEFAPPGYVPEPPQSQGPSQGQNQNQGQGGERPPYSPLPPYASPDESGRPSQGSPGWPPAYPGQNPGQQYPGQQHPGAGWGQQPGQQPGQWGPPGGYPPPYQPYGSPYPGQPGYPQPGYPQSGYPQPGARNGRATAALVLGIASILLCFFTFFDLVPAALAIVFGVIGRKQAARFPDRRGHGAATAGLVCGIVGVVLVGIILAVFLSKYGSCISSGSTPAELRHCIQNR